MARFSDMDDYLRIIDGFLRRVDAASRNRRSRRRRPREGGMIPAELPGGPRPLEGGAVVDPADPLG